MGFVVVLPSSDPASFHGRPASPHTVSIHPTGRPRQGDRSVRWRLDRGDMGSTLVTCPHASVIIQTRRAALRNAANPKSLMFSAGSSQMPSKSVANATAGHNSKDKRMQVQVLDGRMARLALVIRSWRGWPSRTATIASYRLAWLGVGWALSLTSSESKADAGNPDTAQFVGWDQRSAGPPVAAWRISGFDGGPALRWSHPT